MIDVIEKIGSAIVFIFICGIAGLISGLMLIINPTRWIQSIAFVAEAIVLSAALIGLGMWQPKRTKLFYLLGIVNFTGAFALAIGRDINIPGISTGEILIGVLMVASATFVISSSVAIWGNFSKKYC